MKLQVVVASAVWGLDVCLSWHSMRVGQFIGWTQWELSSWGVKTKWFIALWKLISSFRENNQWERCSSVYTTISLFCCYISRCRWNSLYKRKEVEKHYSFSTSITQPVFYQLPVHTCSTRTNIQLFDQWLVCKVICWKSARFVRSLLCFST